MTEARAKPLNALTRAALPRGIEVWSDEIDYLNDILKTPQTNKRFEAATTEKRDALVRAREWLQSKLDSVEDA